MKYDALLAVIVAGCANFSVFLLRPSITSELPDLALAGLWFVAVFGESRRFVQNCTVT
jgi:hypothetical protein